MGNGSVLGAVIGAQQGKFIALDTPESSGEKNTHRKLRMYRRVVREVGTEGYRKHREGTSGWVR